VTESPEALMTIGVFARRSRLSPRALRLYDSQGVLSPARVDPVSGYRWYAEDQLVAARTILLLRQLEMPLAKIAEVLAAPPSDRPALLAEHWDALERRRTGQRQLVELLSASLSGAAESLSRDAYAFGEREVAEQRVITEKAALHLIQLEHWLRTTKARLVRLADRAGGPAADLFVIFHGVVSAESDGPVEVCVPIRSGVELAATTRIEPAHREVFVPITKRQFDPPQILSVYDATEQWCRRRPRTVIGPPREIYRSGLDPHAADPDAIVCELAYPIR
jgi:DNA-binding transcriptional MerR regulator